MTQATTVEHLVAELRAFPHSDLSSDLDHIRCLVFMRRRPGLALRITFLVDSDKQVMHTVVQDGSDIVFDTWEHGPNRWRTRFDPATATYTATKDGLELELTVAATIDARTLSGDA